MASSRWPFWPFGASASSSPTNFLLLSRTNIERICELIRHEEPLNPRQCLSMSSKLNVTVENIESLAPLSEDVNSFYGCVALENFYRVSEKAKKLVENCCSVDWCHWCQASAFQIQNEEAFRELLLETSLSYSTIYELLEDSNKGIFCLDLRSSSTFDPPSAEEIFEDRVALRDRLEGLVNAANISGSDIRSLHLGKYLLGRVNFSLKQSIDEDFDVSSSNLSLDGEDLDGEWSEKSERLGASVIKTTWHGVPCAKKEFEDRLREDEWLAEAKILASLNHPNIVKFLCCNKYETVHTSGHFIAMEQMETSLGSFIRRLKERGANLSLFLSLDIILQIGYGMCYLHDNGIAHRDLKTPNVVCSVNQGFLEVKVVDFGLAKIKLNQDKSNTITRPKIGTTTYMAPEAFSNGRANWFKADVYSFSVMCSVILSGEEPFQDIKRRDLCAAICSGQRPKLPVDIPKELASLIKEGWAKDRDLRPNFLDICARLEKLRQRLLRNHSLHSLGLKLKVEDQYDEEYPDDSYIKKTMKKRSELRQLDRSPQIAMNLTTEEEWSDGDEVEEQQESVQAQQQLLRGLAFQEEIAIRMSAAEDGQGGIDGSSSCGGLQVSPWGFSSGGGDGGVDSPQSVGIALNLSSTSSLWSSPTDRGTVEWWTASPSLITSHPLSVEAMKAQAGVQALAIPRQLSADVAFNSRVPRIASKSLQAKGIRRQSTAQSVLSKYVEEGRTLEELLLHGETSGISDEFRLEILSILEQIDVLSTQAVTILVKISKSKNQYCRQQVARKLRMLVEVEQHLTEFKEAGGIDALLLLLEDPDLNCRQDALGALQALPPSTAIPVGRLPLESILDFLIQKGPDDVTNAAIGLFDSMVKGKAVRADNFLEYEGALEAILSLLDTDSDSPGSQKSASALLMMAKEDHSIRTRIAEPGLRGLDIVVKYVRDHGNIEVKELLTATLVLFCRDGETYQEAVIEADGHRFLITSLQERISKEEAAQGLLELLNNTCTIDVVLDSGFVATALGSIDGRFACIDIALGLSRISSIQEGLNQIYSDSSSVSALLILLEHCPYRSGKNAAALIISRLYPLLYREEDSARREIITEKCQLLLHSLDPFDPHLHKEFLQALAALAAESEGRKTIHQIRGHEILINHLTVRDTEIQGLALKILSEMSSDVGDNGVETYHALMIRVAFLDIRVGEKVFYLLRSDEFGRRTESMKDALILIRNLSLAGSFASRQLVQEGAVSVLLEVLKRHERFLPIVTELALKALEMVLDDPNGKAVFKKGGGIETLVTILKVDALQRAGDAFGRASVAIIILAAVAQDPRSRRHAMEAMFYGDILPALNKLIFDGQRGKIKYQAAVLMKLLAMYWPSKVCIAIKEKGCLDALISLRNLPVCEALATDVLDFLSKKNKACRKYILDNRD